MGRVWDDDPVPFPDYGSKWSRTNAPVSSAPSDCRRAGARPRRSAARTARDQQPVPLRVSLSRMSGGSRRSGPGVPGPLVILLGLWILGMMLEAIIFN